MGTRLSRDEADQQDQQLLAAGELDVLFARYWDSVLAWVHASAKVSRGEAEEIRQDVFLRALREIERGGRFNGVPFGGALYRMAGWVTADYVGGAARRGEHEEWMADGDHREPADHRPVLEMEAIGQDDDVARLFAGLPDRERRLMTLVYLDDLTLGEAADAMGITGNNAHQVHHRAKQRLRQLLDEERG